VTDALGTLRRDDERMSVRFERLYDATPAELWAALTDPTQIRGWLAEATRFELAVGGEIELRFGDGDGELTRGRIRELQPGRVLEYDWHTEGEASSVVRFELVGQEQGTLLVLDHRHLDPDSAPGYGAGWQAHLEALAAPFSGDGEDWWRRYEELRPSYVAAAAAL
jgi:uncharacterized protein YndB with AHSA1/START domain